MHASIATFWRLTFSRRTCRSSKPHTADIADFLLQQDVIYVGWRQHKVNARLMARVGCGTDFERQAWQQGTVLSGVSAGAICWFEQGLTDSIPGKLTPLDCLGFLPGSCSPHYDGETERRPSFQRLVADGEISAGYGIDDCAALHFIGAELQQVVSARAGAAAYRVERSFQRRFRIQGCDDFNRSLS